MIRMVVTSFYNTLIDNEESIPTSTMLEIDRLRQKKILFTINTNRSYKDVLYYNESFPFIDYIISVNGNYIYDVNKNKCIYKSKLTTTSINKINSLFKKDKIKYYSIDNDIYKIEIELTKEFDINKIPSNLSVSILKKDNSKYLEITKNNTYTGLSKLMDKLKLTSKDIIFVGGNESDIPIINNINNNYVVDNSKIKGKKKTSSNELKGLERVIKEI